MDDAVTVSLTRPDFLALGAEWRALELVADLSIFQSWTWVGADVQTRFSNPLLLRAEAGGRIVALALFNGAKGWRGRLHLHETGNTALDRVFIEHNWFPVADGAPPGTREACLHALRRRSLAMNGIGDAALAQARAAGLPMDVRQTRNAPIADLTGGPSLDRLSANTRQQLRRSLRGFAEVGELRTERAEDLATALDWLARLAELHQATWTARGKPGAFADPAFVRFHQSVIAAGLPRSEIDLLRVTAGARAIGYLYNFRHRARISAYQSGFDYPDDARLKPGLTCHYLAMERARNEGATAYDFLAGDDRYKLSLSNRSEALHWTVSDPAWSPSRWTRLIRRTVRASLQTAGAGRASSASMAASNVGSVGSVVAR